MYGNTITPWFDKLKYLISHSNLAHADYYRHYDSKLRNALHDHFETRTQQLDRVASWTLEETNAYVNRNLTNGPLKLHQIKQEGFGLHLYVHPILLFAFYLLEQNNNQAWGKISQKQLLSWQSKTESHHRLFKEHCSSYSEVVRKQYGKYQTALSQFCNGEFHSRSQGSIEPAAAWYSMITFAL